MESGRGRIRRGAALAALTIVVGACAAPAPNATEPVAAPTTVASLPTGATETPSIPDITTRALNHDALGAMLPEGGETTTRANEILILTSTLDRDDQAADIVAAGRETGVGASYERDPGSAHVWIDVLADADAARHFMVDTAGDIAKGVDGTHDPTAPLSEPVEFAAAAGEEAIGLVGQLPDGTTETLIIGRIGRLVFFASEVRPTDSDARVAVQYLADETVDRILSVLTEDEAAPVLRPAAYRFQTTTEVTAESGDSWRTAATGTADQVGVSCRLERSTPVVTTEREMIALGDRVWTKEAGAATHTPIGPSITTAQALAWCPQWPLSATAARLTVPTSGPRHHVNGVDATGGHGDTTDLRAVFGISDPLVAVETFSYWIADETDWLVELSLLLTGPADALGPLIGPEFAGAGTVTVTVRHRVLDLGSVEPLVAPS